jgi:hypothetical protein
MLGVSQISIHQTIVCRTKLPIHLPIMLEPAVVMLFFRTCGAHAFIGIIVNSSYVFL